MFEIKKIKTHTLPNTEMKKCRNKGIDKITDNKIILQQIKILSNIERRKYLGIEEMKKQYLFSINNNENQTYRTF